MVRGRRERHFMLANIIGQMFQGDLTSGMTRNERAFYWLQLLGGVKRVVFVFLEYIRVRLWFRLCLCLRLCCCLCPSLCLHISLRVHFGVCPCFCLFLSLCLLLSLSFLVFVFVFVLIFVSEF
jgi:hypothetical protein